MPAPTDWLRSCVREPERRRPALLFVLVSALSFVPMAGTLGYFSSLLIAPVLAVLSSAAGVDAVTRVRAGSPAPKDGREALWRTLGHGARELAILVGLPPAILTVAMLWTTNCDPLGGAAYYAIGPLCSAPLGWLAGVTMAALMGPRRRWLLLLAAVAPLLLSVLIGLRRIYVDPAVFAYDPFVGWFSGPIYDEGVAISLTYLRFRAYNLVAAAAVWLGLRACVDESLRPELRRGLSDGRRRLESTAALVLALAALLVGLSADRLRFHASTESLGEALGSTYETEHFVIHYGPTSPSAKEIEMVAVEHEFAWSRLERRLGRAPDRKVHSFLFVNGKQRGALIGANVVEVSPPWRQQMYLSHRVWPHEVMHHELAHAFLGDVGDPLLGLPISGLRFSGALVEGLPSALAPRHLDNLDVHEQAAILDRLDKRPPLAEIMGAGFWGAAASRAYTAAGSFVLFLAETRSWEQAAVLYANAGDFEATYGASLTELEAEWLEFLRGLPLREQDIAAMAQRFQRGSVFRRPCAHRVAKLRGEAIKARLFGREDEALSTQKLLCSLEPKEPGHFLGLAEMLASWQRFDEATTVLDELADQAELTATIRAIIDEQRGDTALVAGELGAAGAHYQRAVTHGVDEGRRRQLQIKQIATTDTALAPLIVDYFRPFELEDESRAAAVLQLWTATRIAELPGHHALGHYLLGRLFLNNSAPAEARLVLAKALVPALGEAPLSTVELRRAAHLAQLSALTQTRAWDEARALLEPLRELAEGRGHLDEVEEWRERIDFFEAWFASS